MALVMVQPLEVSLIQIENATLVIPGLDDADEQLDTVTRLIETASVSLDPTASFAEVQSLVAVIAPGPDQTVTLEPVPS